MIAPPKPPSHDELEALIKEARARQLRRRLLGAAGLAIAAALGLSIYAVAIGSTVSGSARANAAGAGAPLCESSQLATTAGLQGATQTMLGGMTLENISAAACSLPQIRPRMTLSWRGEPLPTQQRKMTTAPPWPLARVLAPGAKADVFFQWWSCGGSGPKAAVRPAFTLRFGQRLVVTARSSDVTTPFCGGLGGTRSLDVSRALVQH